MPQGRRKTPFSGKAKKEQLKAKKQGKTNIHNAARNMLLVKNDEEEAEGSGVQKLNFQPSKSSGQNTNKYVLQFHKETEAELKERKEKARHALKKVSEEELEINSDDYFVAELDFPKRPKWNYNLSKDTLETNEQRYFTEYINNIEKNFSWKELSFFELNLETWRQLWRVLEMSDIILFIADIRYAGLMFPPFLYNYVRNELKKDIILVLNKVDLAPAPLVAAWKNYFQQKYPDLHIVMFTTLPGYNLVGKQSDKGGLQVRKKKGRIRMAVEGTQMLFNACKDIVGDSVDLTSWHNKIKEESTLEFEDDESVQVENVLTEKNDTSFFEHEKYKNGILTIGCLGQPNVGKSSLMNAIMGKKVVSVSKTPGHTKHFQTIFLTQNVRLCDCPGLVFPSKVPKVNQVLMGSFPIAQLREPFSTIQYLGERLDLPKLLRIEHPENDEEWSAMDICDGWAKKRGYRTAKAARLDSYRAANSLLRLALDGTICFCLTPPLYTKNKEFWANHKDTDKVKWIQVKDNESGDTVDNNFVYISESEEEDMKKQKEALKKEESETSENEECDDDDEDDEEEEAIVTANNFSALQVNDD